MMNSGRPESMMDSRRTERMMVSRRYMEMEQCTHVFKIDGYSMEEELVDAYGFSEYATFTASGHEWCFVFYPKAAKEG
jgi:hypothetical protein